MEEEILYTEPLDEVIKKRIYSNFQALQRQHSVIYEYRGKGRISHILRHFRKYYIRFYTNVYSTDMYSQIDEKIRRRLDYYANNLLRINTKENMLDIVLKSASVLRNMNLTKMSQLL